MAIPGRHSQTFRWEWARGGGRKHVQVYSYYAVVYLLLFCLFLYCIILCICTSCNIVYVYKRGKARHKLNLEKGERMHLREWTLLGGKVGGGRGEGGAASSWRAYVAPNGHEYYHNETSGETTWTKPLGSAQY
jgi:hypothetical protein